MAYAPWIEDRLQRVEDRLASGEYERAVTPFLSMQHTPRTRAEIKAVVMQLVRRLQTEEGVPEVPFYLAMPTDPDPTRCQLALSIPKFTHDCDRCTFLGRVTFSTWRGEETFDLYTCDKAGWRTFIYRYGDQGPAYTSVPASSLPQGPHPALFECVRRAREEGLR